ncbi:MAG: hypothetical protein OK457_11285 [Thaumarchaeota archaeon]|nr:hypothetical protein [Nitrososphaerota archaeon]
MNPADLGKLEGYVAYLDKKAVEEEKGGQFVDAIATNFKLVDVLLVLAEATTDYPKWLKCTNSASNHQKKIKSLIALASLKQKEEAEQQFPKNAEPQKLLTTQ